MEKLIELLNEYGKTSNCWPFETCRLEPATDYASSYLVLSWDDNWEWDWKDWHLEVPRLISKEYGFIWWLVENDKIDIESYCRITSIERKWEKDVYRDEVDSLLMLLAVQDEPIRFLCEIIK